MEFAPAGVPLSCEVTFDRSDLPVAMMVFDDTGALPVLLLSPFAMALVSGNTYRGKFTGQNGKNYIVIKAVYTDDTFTELDPNYAQGSESIVVQNFNASSGGNVIGFVVPNPTVIGLVDC